MRLSQIKIAGFKSFVDPTKIVFPKNLTGIVGPNGCGKSNVIDAVRWVMGESSAKHLRGESMDDVIFSGSSTRKPVGQATVELVFDNTQGKAQGEYAKFNEISVKRLVSRDGQSKYFLNNTRCRRRDIADLFLGTGLGPRSYAIIEQGMISRIIDAKPEELRVYFEEAAGISKYKERRRETANRIKHTRENLERLTDVRDEVEKQIKRLDRQAKTADKYKLLKAQLRRFQAELLVLQRRQLESQHQQINQSLSAIESQFQQAVAQLRQTESSLEKSREELIVANEKQNSIQGEFYRVGSEIASKEQSLAHQQQQLQQNQQTIQQTKQQLKQKQQALQTDETSSAQLQQKLQQIEPEINSTRSQQTALDEAVALAEQALSDWQQEWDNFNKEFNTQQQSANIENNQISHLEKQLSQSKRRSESLKEEFDSLNTAVYDSEIDSLKISITQFEEQIEQHQLTLKQQQTERDTITDSLQKKELELNQQRTEVQHLKGAYSSLKTLQEAALNTSSQQLSEWAQQQGIANKKLASSIKVQAEAEKAVEVVLGPLLAAYCDDQQVVDSINGLEQENFAIINQTKTTEERPNQHPDWTLLTSLIDSEYDLNSVFGTVYFCQDEALFERRNKLNSGESLISASGTWVGSNWIMQHNDDEKKGVIHREKEMQQLQQNLQNSNEQVINLQSQIEAQRQQQKHFEHNINQSQQEIHRLQKQLSAQQQSLAQTSTRKESIEQRQLRIQNDLSSLSDESKNTATDLQISTQKRNDILIIINDLSSKREVISNKRTELNNELAQSRKLAKENSDLQHRLLIKQQALQSEFNNAQQSIARLLADEKQLQQSYELAKENIKHADQPIQQLQQQLQFLVKDKAIQQADLTKAQETVTTLDQQQRELEQQRHNENQTIESLRQKVESAKLQSQEVSVRIATLNEQLAQTDYNVKALDEELSQQALISEYQQKIEQLQQKINQLGQINLAAIDQFAEETERKKYLDDQDADLNKSLETLEAAIKKIDRETKDRFKEIFDHVNEKMKIRFPKLFGGGEAHLELTENDLLTTGVVIMARPPGKRVNSLQLLSGGEKALTAVALIFAIFELNPSPFCMLDEVDAPLDDANVGRFCAMVEEMSKQVQFIFISHNKITMELADNLNGVTMHEPGASRLVTVNLNEAAELIDKE